MFLFNLQMQSHSTHLPSKRQFLWCRECRGWQEQWICPGGPRRGCDWTAACDRDGGCFELTTASRCWHGGGRSLQGDIFSRPTTASTSSTASKPSWMCYCCVWRVGVRSPQAGESLADFCATQTKWHPRDLAPRLDSGIRDLKIVNYVDRMCFHCAWACRAALRLISWWHYHYFSFVLVLRFGKMENLERKFRKSVKLNENFRPGRPQLFFLYG